MVMYANEVEIKEKEKLLVIKNNYHIYMYIHRNLAISHHPRPNTEATSKILNTSIIV